MADMSVRVTAKMRIAGDGRPCLR
ncbi:MAG: hypothetical protein HY735_37370 [Verrucomicrobia bacterium]|nr:hypothetical protein [Verrucomicrobiota bacterium]